MAFPVVYTPEPTRPSGTPRQGTKLLYSFILQHFSVTGLGIYNPRDVKGNEWPNWTATGSQHASGRAGDCGVPIVRPGAHPEGHRLAYWLVVNAAALGIQEVIFAGQRWTNQTQAWRHYTGRSDHYDHVHWAQNAEAAGSLTREQIEAVWATGPNEGDDWMGDPYDRDEVVGRLDEIRTGLADLHRKAVANEERDAVVLAAIEALDDSGPGGLSKADVVAAVKQALREGTG